MGETELAGLQRRLARAIVAEAEGAPPPRGLVPGGGLTPAGAVDVYRAGYRARLTEALGETFEAVWAVLGDEVFFRRCREYIESHRSTFYNLSDYGADFPRFLADVPEAVEFPFLAELAAFERAFAGLFHQGEHGHADLAAAGAAGLGPGSRLVVGGAVRLLRHERSVYEVWKRRGERGPLAAEVWRQPESLVLYKKGGEIFGRPLGAAEFAALSELRDGGTVERALEAGCAAEDGFGAERVAELFAFVGESGLVEAVRPPDGGRP